MDVEGWAVVGVLWGWADAGLDGADDGGWWGGVLLGLGLWGVPVGEEGDAGRGRLEGLGGEGGAVGDGEEEGEEAPVGGEGVVREGRDG